MEEPDPPVGGSDAPTIRVPGPLSPPAHDPSTLLRVASLVASEPTVIPGSLATVPSSPARPHVPKKLGPYELLGELGRGGMGMVFRARHERLGTACALKVLIAGEHASPESIARFQREAASVARMGKHPNIVAVFDLGQEGSLAWYAMELVEGRSLAERLREGPLPVAEAAALLEKVARALSFAHEHGVIHRDIKPENIVLRGCEPQVMDFGLALDQRAGARLSVSGDIMGTPAYMAPEQARGEVDRIDARTDVYGVGAVMYEALTGIPPHRGTDMFDLLARVAEGEIVPPRRLRADLPRDGETVCLRALSPEREGRYPSAAALADDLGRLVRGEPVQARPVSPIERALRYAVRRRAVVLPSALAAIAVVALGAWLLTAHFRNVGAVEADLARGRECRAKDRAREAHDAFRDALKLDPSCAEAAAGLRWVEKEIHRLDAEAEEAKRRAEEAERILGKARFVSKVLARWSRLAGTLKELETARFDPTLGDGVFKERVRELWTRVEAFLRDTPDDSASQATARALAGWARRLARDETAGIEMMRKAAEIDPEVPFGTFMEAIVLFSEYVGGLKVPTVRLGLTGIGFDPIPPESDALLETRERMERLLAAAERAPVWGQQGAEDFLHAIQAMRSVRAGEHERAERELTEALGVPELAAFGRDLLLARSLVRFLRKRFTEAIADVDEVLDVRPMDPNARTRRALVLHALGKLAQVEGRDARPRLAQAIEDLEVCRRASPSDPKVSFLRGVVLATLGETQGMQAEDSRPTYEQAIEAYDAALAIEPRDRFALLARVGALLGLGLEQSSRGTDARPTLTRAIKESEALTSARPDDPEFHACCGHAWRALYEAEVCHGAEAEASLRRAMAEFEKALASRPGDPSFLVERANASTFLGQVASETGGDPRPALEAAVADFDAALDRFPQYVLGREFRARALGLLGDAESVRGIDPRPRYERELADGEASIAVSPKRPFGWMSKGTALLRLAALELSRGSDPRPSYRSAIEAYTEAAKLGPDSYQAHIYRGMACGCLGQAEAVQGNDARGPLEDAVAEFDKAIGLNPGSVEALVDRGGARVALAHVLARAGEDAGPTIEAALADFDHALKRAPSAALYVNRAGTWLVLGRLKAARGEDASDAFEKGLEDSRRATTMLPRYKDALVARGHLQVAMGDFAAAVKSYEEAIEACGDTDPVLRAHRDRARARLEPGK